MDARGFDSLTRALAAGTSRRRVFAGLLGLVLGASAPGAGRVGAAGCGSDADCPGGQTCFNAACQARCTTTGPCQTDSECCGPGQTCVNGACHHPGDAATAPASTPPTATTASVGVSGSTYISPSYGYRLAWDTTWSVTKATSASGRDELVLSNGTSNVGFFGYPASGDPSQCLQQAKADLFDPTKNLQVTVANDTAGQPMQQTTKDRAYAVYTYQDVSQGSPRDRAAYFDCRALEPGKAVLLIVDDVARNVYNAQFQLVETLLTRLDLPLTGVKAYTGLSHQHTTGRVTYPQVPPVGGPHNPVWQNCGFYDTPIANEHAVHSLEHGAVWITYQPNLPADQVAVLRTLAQQYDYVLVSPYPGLPTPVVATAWGFQLQLDGADAVRLRSFIATYRHGPDTEQGGPCTGGTSSPGF